MNELFEIAKHFTLWPSKCWNECFSFYAIAVLLRGELHINHIENIECWNWNQGSCLLVTRSMLLISGTFTDGISYKTVVTLLDCSKKESTAWNELLLHPRWMIFQAHLLDAERILLFWYRYMLNRIIWHKVMSLLVLSNNMKQYGMF